jgi:hypothetical protein
MADFVPKPSIKRLRSRQVSARAREVCFQPWQARVCGHVIGDCDTASCLSFDNSLNVIPALVLLQMRGAVGTVTDVAKTELYRVETASLYWKPRSPRHPRYLACSEQHNTGTRNRFRGKWDRKVSRSELRIHSRSLRPLLLVPIKVRNGRSPESGGGLCQVPQPLDGVPPPERPGGGRYGTSQQSGQHLGCGEN